MADYDENQELDESSADSLSSVYEEQTSHELRKSPRKTVVLSGTYKIRGKPPFKSRQHKVSFCRKVIFPRFVSQLILFVLCKFMPG